MQTTKYKSTNLILLYAIIAVINLIGNSCTIPILIYLSKPFLMPILLLFYWQNRLPNQHLKFQRLIGVGLVFAFLGDMFLLFEGSSYFLLGLSCFFMTHILYSIAFFLRMSIPKWIHMLATVPFLVYYIWMGNFLFGQLSADFKIPVLAYSSIITIMAIIGTLLSFRLPYPKSYFLFMGILLFVISDSYIAFERFTDLEIPFPRFTIMSTYILAQLGIVLGTLVRTDRTQVKAQ
ncbi:MAG: lysoplasmalogenase [Bacteroidota bacterium]